MGELPEVEDKGEADPAVHSENIRRVGRGRQWRALLRREDHRRA
jgi:hypothetical protein